MQPQLRRQRFPFGLLARDPVLTPNALGSPSAAPGPTQEHRGQSQMDWHPPFDLSTATGKPGLLKLCFEAVQRTGEEELAQARHWLAGPGHQPAARPEMFVSLLAYCYSIGLYASEDIAAAARTDATVRYICAGYRPDELTIRRFRRHHRSLLRAALLHVFTQTWTFHFETGEADYAGCDWFESELTRQLEQSATARLDVAAMFDDVD